MQNGPTGFSLAAVEANQEVLIERILFPLLSDFCAPLGISEGSVVRCRAASLRRLYLFNGVGRTVAIDRDRARFILVAPARANDVPAPRTSTLS